ncbi:MAG: helix-turn-helix domain-containing protein [Pirellulales bacterium]
MAGQAGRMIKRGVFARRLMDLGMTQAKVAEVLNISPAAISQWLRKKLPKGVAREHQQPLADLLGVTIDELFEPQTTMMASKEPVEWRSQQRSGRRKKLVALASSSSIAFAAILASVVIISGTYESRVDVTEEYVGRLADQIEGEAFRQGETILLDRTNDKTNVGNDTKGTGVLRVKNLGVADGGIVRTKTRHLSWTGWKESISWSSDLRLWVEFEADSSAARYYYAGLQLGSKSRWKESHVPGIGELQVLLDKTSDDAEVAVSLKSVLRTQQHDDASLADEFIEKKLLTDVITPAKETLERLGIHCDGDS